MATAFAVLSALADQVSTVCAGIYVNSVLAPISVAVGWPPENLLRSVPKGGTSYVGVFDRGVSMNTKRWPAILAVPDVAVTCGLTVTTQGLSPLLGSGSLTISGTPVINDTVVFSFGNGGIGTTAVVGYKALTAVTLAEFATALAAQISTLAGLSAVSSGGVIEVTSTVGATTATANAANQATRTTEWGRLSRHIAVSFWCPSQLYRSSITDPFETYLAMTRDLYGFQLENGEWIRLMYERDILIEDAQLQSVFRRDFFMECEYGLTGVEQVYPVLGGGFSVTVNGATSP